MINRIFRRGGITNYIDIEYQYTCVTFSGLEPLTKLRLLALGYCPAVKIYSDWNDCYVPLGIGLQADDDFGENSKSY